VNWRKVTSLTPPRRERPLKTSFISIRSCSERCQASA
jgi:hypothetical protein